MNWKDHPFAVAVVASLATLTACVTLLFTAVLPTWLKAKDNEIAALQTEPTKLKAENSELSNQLRQIENENLKLRRDLDTLSPDSLFSLGDVYPRGFRSVRIGDRVERLRQVYGSDADFKEDDGPWITVVFKKPTLFSEIVYYYDEAATVKTVTFVLFYLDGNHAQTYDVLKQALIDRYSQPTSKGKKGVEQKHLVWSGIQQHTLKLDPVNFQVNRDRSE